MAKKSALGAKFESIFDDSNMFSDEENGISMLKITEIEPNRDQPRKDFDKNALDSLANSILQHGIIQPLTVRQKGESYQIVAGERRWRAAKIAGLSEVPVRIMELSDTETAQIALIENLQREDLNPLEEAMGYKRLMEQFKMRQEDVATVVGKARSSVANALRILDLPEEVKELLRQGKLSLGHCKALLGASDDVKRLELAHKAANGDITVRQLERLCAPEVPKNRAVKQKNQTPFFTEAEISLKQMTGQTVKITPKKNKISLEFTCKNEDELRELIRIIGK